MLLGHMAIPGVKGLNLYAEQYFRLQNGKSPTTKDFRFRASYFEKVDCCEMARKK